MMRERSARGPAVGWEQLLRAVSRDRPSTGDASVSRETAVDAPERCDVAIRQTLKMVSNRAPHESGGPSS
jgi:hypothetical protein